MNILITGGTGFIGTHLVQELAKYNHSLYVLTRDTSKSFSNVSIINGDITRPESLSLALKGIDAVFHNAALARDSGSKKEIFNVNVIGTKNLAEACIKNNVTRIVFTSSAGVYGFPNSMEQITEVSPTNPFNHYQTSKLMGEEVLKNYKELTTSIIRPPLVLGNGGMVAKVLLTNLKRHRMLYIGKGNNFVPIVHPCDVAQCLRLALEKDEKGEIFNVVSFHCTIQELFKKITNKLSTPEPTKHISYMLAYLYAVFSEKFSSDPRLTRFRLKTLSTSRVISYEKAKRNLGFQPQYTLQRTIEDMIKSL